MVFLMEIGSLKTMKGNVMKEVIHTYTGRKEESGG
jgi:hypothetical protein